MNVKSNKIKDLISFYHECLQSIYTKDEIHELIYIAFSFLLKFTREDIHNKKEESLNQSNLLLLYGIANELASKKPIQYILKEAWFYGDKYFVNEQVLIPRPETEELVELICNENTQTALVVVDIGTGSGCIPIAIKKKNPNWLIHAIDVSFEALVVAKKNAETLHVEVQFHQEDILTLKQLNNHTFDIIVSNPPYIAKEEARTMQSSVVDFEPHLALFVENANPLLFYDKIADFALINLNKKGKLYFEINQRLGKEVQQLLISKGFQEVTLHKDISGNNRMIGAMV